MEIWIIGVEEIRFEPSKCSAFEVRLSKSNFGSIGAEGVWTILEVQFTLNQELTEFLRIGAIKGIGFPAFSTGGGVLSLRGKSFDCGDKISK